MLMAAAGLTLGLFGLTHTYDPPSPALDPTPRSDPWWISRHDDTVARIREGHIDLIMIGDSITQGWNGTGHAVWDQYYQRRHAFNLGFNGDRTEHVLWRLNHGEIDGITPKLVVLLIGTNNTGMRHDSSKDTTAGIQAILTILQSRLPATKILLLGLFPRSASPDDPLRQLNDAINARLRSYADNRQVYFLDLSERFLDRHGRLSHNLMPDYLHPNEAGYRVWAEGMEDMIRTLLEE